MNRITAAFQRLAQQNRKALVGYLTAGDPDPDTSFDILRAACGAGLDILELGVPFSDPTADGPVIQEASQRSLQAGMTLTKTLEIAARLRAESEIPIMLFGYYNPLFKYGLDRLAQAAAKASIDGLLVVDLPRRSRPAENRPPGHRHPDRLPCRPDDPPRPPAENRRRNRRLPLPRHQGRHHRRRRTGLRAHPPPRRRSKEDLPLPVCLGFGIRNGDDAARLAPMADGVIVGSTLVNVIGSNLSAPDLPERMAEKIRDLRAGLDRD